MEERRCYDRAAMLHAVVRDMVLGPHRTRPLTWTGLVARRRQRSLIAGEAGLNVGVGARHVQGRAAEHVLAVPHVWVQSIQFSHEDRVSDRGGDVHVRVFLHGRAFVVRGNVDVLEQQAANVRPVPDNAGHVAHVFETLVRVHERYDLDRERLVATCVRQRVVPPVVSVPDPRAGGYELADHGRVRPERARVVQWRFSGRAARADVRSSHKRANDISVHWVEKDDVQHCLFRGLGGGRGVARHERNHVGTVQARHVERRVSPQSGVLRQRICAYANQLADHSSRTVLAGDEEKPVQILGSGCLRQVVKGAYIVPSTCV